MRIRVRHKDAALSRVKVINELSKMTEGTLIEYRDSELYRTPETVREMGIVVCSTCGSMTSDAKDKCPCCGEELFIVRDRVAVKKETPVRKENELVSGQSFHVLVSDEHGNCVWEKRHVLAVKTAEHPQTIRYNGSLYKKFVQPGTHYLIAGEWREQKEIDKLIELKNRETT